MNFSNEQIQQAQDAYGDVINKCWEDEQFKNDLIANPKETLKREGFNVDLPDGFKFQVTDQTSPKTIYINIPAYVNAENMELSDEMLEAVSGGCICILWYQYLSPQAVGKRHALADNETYGC